MEKIFISYSHDSTEHLERVLALANRLRKNGLDCILDQYESSPAEGWPVWMERQLEQAEHVIIIGTETYWRRVTGKEEKGKGKGVKWESTLTYQYIYDNDSQNTRFIPVVFDENDCQYIPTPLKGATFYCLKTEADYINLYRRLTKQPEIEKPDLGPKIKLSPKKTAEVFVDSLTNDPKVSLYKLPVTGDRLFGREKELKLLDDAWSDIQTSILTLVAWGGVGKTALVNQWLNHMKTANYRGAQKVFGWSFYSQGAEEGKQSSADEFFQETLQWFGDGQPEAGSAVDKGRRLARLIRQQKTLLILDGLEPLQYPPGELKGLEGKLKDNGLAAFLKELAGSNAANKVLCVITTREPVTDLLNRKGYGVNEISLEHLSAEAGVELLKSLGVITGSKKDFQEAVKEYGGHALALTLLGHYIKSVHGGDIRRRDEIPLLTKERLRGRHALRVMEGYEKWFGPSPELNILYLVGLFDRPVEAGAIEALKKEPAIPGVTDRLQNISPEDWQWALSHLREARLLAAENPQKPGMLDCHPLVREFFGEKLHMENSKGWQAAHERLYRYFKDLPGKKLPDTLAEMEPLFAAVAHGCRAGLHQEVLDEVYWKRIRRGNEAYTVHKLGAFGSDLACLAHFFDVPWSRPAAGLTESDKALVLSWAAFRLRALGRLWEASQAMEATLERYKRLQDPKEIAIAASNLSELLLTLGDVKEAVAAARQSVTHADQSGDEFWKEASRTTLADALHQAGELIEAEQWFREAEALHKKSQPEYPFLYGLAGFQFCDLLLENPAPGQDQVQEVIERAEKALEIAKRNKWLLDISLDNLTLGRAWMMNDQRDRALAYLEQAVAGLRKSGNQDDLPRGLLARAACYRHMKDYSRAQDDLAEAREIAELSHMKLHLCDYHLEAGRLAQAQGKNDEAHAADTAAEHFHAAKNLIEETGYFRRKKELEIINY